MAQNIGGLQGGIAGESGGIRTPAGDVRSIARSRETAAGELRNGDSVEGLVTGKEGELYYVRVGARQLAARSTVPLFVGQRFRAVWDATTSPPTLRLADVDSNLLARFTGRDRQVALEFLQRGLPVQEEVLFDLRKEWMRQGGDPARLGTLVELWARGEALSEANALLLLWYGTLSPQEAAAYWRRIRERLRSRDHESPSAILKALRGEDEEDDVARFLEAHALAGRPAKRGLSPAFISTASWWPVDEGDEQAMARVSFFTDESKGRRAVWLSFEMEGIVLGPLLGQAMTNGRALSISIRLAVAEQVPSLRAALPRLREELLDIATPIQYLGVGEIGSEELPDAARRVDVEA